MVHRLVVSASNAPYLEKPNLVSAGDALKTDESEKLNRTLDKLKEVLRNMPGHTEILLPHVNTRQALPITRDVLF